MMPDPQRSFFDKQSRLVHGFAIKSQEVFSDYMNELQELSADAKNRVRLLWENDAPEVRAAASGDDAAERSSVAYRNFQREYARLGAEHAKACQGLQAKLAESIQGLQAGARLQALDDTIDYLSEVRRALFAGSPQPEEREGTG